MCFAAAQHMHVMLAVLKNMKEISEGTVQISRTSQWANSARSIKLFIDDQSSGSIKDGEVVSIIVPEGKHKVYAKIDWSKTKPVIVDVRAGKNVILEVGSSIKGWKVHLSLLYLFLPHKWIYLKKNDKHNNALATDS